MVATIYVNKRGEVTIPFFRVGSRAVPLDMLLNLYGLC